MGGGGWAGGGGGAAPHPSPNETWQAVWAGVAVWQGSVAGRKGRCVAGVVGMPGRSTTQLEEWQEANVCGCGAGVVKGGVCVVVVCGGQCRQAGVVVCVKCVCVVMVCGQGVCRKVCLHPGEVWCVCP